MECFDKLQECTHCTHCDISNVSAPVCHAHGPHPLSCPYRRPRPVLYRRGDFVVFDNSVGEVVFCEGATHGTGNTYKVALLEINQVGRASFAEGSYCRVNETSILGIIDRKTFLSLTNALAEDYMHPKANQTTSYAIEVNKKAVEVLVNSRIAIPIREVDACATPLRDAEPVPVMRVTTTATEIVKDKITALEARLRDMEASPSRGREEDELRNLLTDIKDSYKDALAILQSN